MIATGRGGACPWPVVCTAVCACLASPVWTGPLSVLAGLGEGKKSSTGRGPAPRPQDFGPRVAGEDRLGRLSVCGGAARSPRTSGCARASARRPVSARFCSVPESLT